MYTDTWYTDNALMMYCWYATDAMVMYWWCTDYALMIHRWCTNNKVQAWRLRDIDYSCVVHHKIEKIETSRQEKRPNRNPIGKQLGLTWEYWVPKLELVNLKNLYKVINTTISVLCHLVALNQHWLNFWLREAVKYYFADFVRKGGGGGTP